MIVRVNYRIPADMLAHRRSPPTYLPSFKNSQKTTTARQTCGDKLVATNDFRDGDGRS